MPSRDRYLGSLVEDYLRRLRRRGKANENTVIKYRRILNGTLRTLQEAGLRYTPRKIGEDEIDYLLEETWSDLGPSTKRWQISIFGKFLKTVAQNFVVDEMMIVWPTDNRVHVDWLSPEEAIALLEAARGVERVLIHLELRLGLRRIEVRRLRISDIEDGTIQVHGKGRGGGKWRTIAFAPDTLAELQYYERLRERLIEEARRKNPVVTVPDRLLIYRMGRRLGAYGNTALDNILKEAARRSGVQRSVSHHTLRRSKGRFNWMSGVDLVTISESYGHADTKQTVRYLGLTVEDLASAEEKTYDFLQEVRISMSGKEIAHAPVIRVSR